MSKLKWILDALEQTGKTRSGLAKALGRQPSMVTDLLNGARELRASEIPIIANYLGVIPPSPLAGVVLITAKIGATADGELRFATDGKNFGETPMPTGSDRDVVAVEVEGDQIRNIAQDGSLIYYDSKRRLPATEMLGELCVIGLSDNRVVLKYLHPGSHAGVFDLESAATPTLRDVPVTWAALVTAIIPRPAAQKLIRREKKPDPAPAPRRSPRKRK